MQNKRNCCHFPAGRPPDPTHCMAGHGERHGAPRDESAQEAIEGAGELEGRSKVELLDLSAIAPMQ